jgi:LacI family repressor for deo operon, udp, cdd, tsx, nupC, and nupG
MTRGVPVSDRPRRATIEDVASAAGVSVATVSRAMRGLPNVAQATRQHVTQVARELSYQPDPAAARLATGRSRSIALVVPMLNSWYFSQVVAGAEAATAADGYDVMVIGAAGPSALQALFAATASIHRRVDGLLFVDVPLEEADAEDLAGRGMAVVTVGSSTVRFPSLGIDDVAVGKMATEHLLALGHRRIGLITSQPDDPLGFVVPDLRRSGFQSALADAGIEADPTTQIGGNFTVAGGRVAMNALLELPDPPTAVFAMSDEMAFGAMWAARDAKVAVPSELSIIGVDDHDVSAVLGLTTVRQSPRSHGARAVRLLIEQLAGRAVSAERIEAPVELVVRETTAAAPSR